MFLLNLPIFLHLLTTLSQPEEISDLLHLIDSDNLITPELKTYLKYINKDNLEGLYQLVPKIDHNPIYKLIYVHNAYYPHTIVRDARELCELLLPLAQEVSDQYRNNRYIFKSKLILKDSKETLEVKKNADTILKLALSGDKKGVKVFLNSVEKGIFDVKDHIDTLEKLGRMGYPLAYGILGELYYVGHSVTQNIEKAKEYFKLGSKKNEPMSLHGLGLIYLNEEKNVKSAKNYFIAAMHKGSVAASYSFYLCGENDPSSNIIGLTYLTSAASRGYIPAMFSHAKLIYKSKRYMDALSYFISISKYSNLMRELSIKAEEYFFNGNFEKSLIYYLILSETGSYSAIDNAVYLIDQKKVLKNDELFFYLLNKSLGNGIFTYLVEIGDCYFYGKGIDLNYTKAFSYYLSAALHGSFKGIFSLSYMYFRGLGCKKNIFKAVKYVCKTVEFESFGYIFIIYLVPYYILISLLESIPVKDIFLASFVTFLFFFFHKLILLKKNKI